MQNEFQKTLGQISILLDSNLEKDYDYLKENWVNASWEEESWYPKFLANHYFIVSHTEKLISLAAAHTDLVDFRRSMIKHFGDEEDHEEILLDDLNQLKFKITDFEEHPSSKTVYQTQYFDIEKNSPESILGRILALELMATEVFPGIYKKTSEKFGVQACKFIKTHAEEDVDHVLKAVQTAEKIIKEKPESKKYILDQFRQTCWVYSKYLSDI